MLRRHKRILLVRENTSLSEILFPMRKVRRANQNSPAEIQLGRHLKTWENHPNNVRNSYMKT